MTTYFRISDRLLFGHWIPYSNVFKIYKSFSITQTSSLQKLVEDVQESFTGWVPQQIWSFKSQWSTLTFKQHEVCTNHRDFQTSLTFSIRRAGGRHIIQFSGEGDITVMEADVTDPTALVGAPGGFKMVVKLISNSQGHLEPSRTQEFFWKYCKLHRISDPELLKLL